MQSPTDTRDAPPLAAATLSPEPGRGYARTVRDHGGQALVFPSEQVWPERIEQSILATG
jgi:hypothetical protein